MPPADDDLVLPLPPSAPRLPAGGFGRIVGRWLGRTILRLGGWRMEGAFPDIPRLVLVGAPHSSNWDGIWGLAAKLALGLDIKLLGKQELFWWPLGPLLRRMGVIAIDRHAAHGTVEQMARLIRDSERLWLGIAPEGTRRKVARWKTGFWKIAKAADVPVLPAYFDYPRKVIGIGPTFAPGADMDADLARIRAWYQPWRGKHHDVD